VRGDRSMCGRFPPIFPQTQRRVAAEAGELDILVNNAGAIPPGDVLSVDDARWREAWDLKVFGYISFCRVVYAQMKARQAGVIINIIGAAGESFPTGYIAGAAGNASLMDSPARSARVRQRTGCAWWRSIPGQWRPIGW